MMAIQPANPLDLLSLANSYNDAEQFKDFEQTIWNKINAYNASYGKDMNDHLARVSTHLYGVLKFLGYDDLVARNLSNAFRVHDGGKILQPESLWGLDDKPSDDVRAQRPNHTNLGIKLLEETLESFPHLKDHAHITIMACFAKYHHERISGKGPQGLSNNELGEVLEIAGIVDGLDGKSMIRAKDKTNIPSKDRSAFLDKTAQALRDMTGLCAYTDTDKHKGEFRTDLLMRIIPYYEKTFGISVLPPIAAIENAA